MKLKMRLLALLLAVVLVVGMVPAVGAAEGSAEGGVILDKTATVDYTTGAGTIELSSYVKGEVKNTPTDVVMVIDQSGSMWTAVDPDNTMTLDELDEEKGARRGYYIAFDLDGVNANGDGKARLVRYKNGIWQVTDTLDATIYEKGTQDFIGFINTCSYDTEAEWHAIPNNANYIYAVSISGALYEAMNIFMDEMENAMDCRVAICTFAGTVREEVDGSVVAEEKETANELNAARDYNGSGIFVKGELKWDSTAQTWEKPWSNTYGAAFEDPSTAEGQDILYDTIEKINTDFGNTPTALGLLYARRLLNEAGREGANKVVIVFTDGIPSPINLRTRRPDSCTHGNTTFYVEKYTSDAAAKEAAYQHTGGGVSTVDGKTVYTSGCDYCEPARFKDADGKQYYRCMSTYVDQANKLKTYNNATVYSIGPTAGRAGTDVLSKIATSNDHYYNASGDDIAKVFRDIAGFIVSSSQDLNADTHAVDVISDSFMLPEGTDEDDIKVYTADYIGEVNGKDSFKSELVPLENAQVKIDGKKVEVWGFDYKQNAVGMEGTNPKGKKLIVRIPVVKEPDFLGGDNVNTNDSSSGIYNDDVLVDQFPMPYVDVVVGNIFPTSQNKDIYLSQSAQLPALANIGHFSQNGGNYQVDGINNAYVDIIYTIQELDANGNPTGTKLTYTIPAGTHFNGLTDQGWGENVITHPLLKEDATYRVTIEVESTNKETNRTSNSENASIRVFKPVITFKDSSINLGQAANYETQNFVKVEWMHGQEYAYSEMGPAPTLEYTYDPVAGDFKKDTEVKVTVTAKADGNKVPEDQVITPYVKFFRDACTFRDCTHTTMTEVSATDNNRVNFVVHLNSFDLTIKKDVDGTLEDPNQSFLFHVTGPNNFSMDVIVVGEGSVTIKGLQAGEYTITEQTGWSWRYNCTNGATKTASAANAVDGVTTVTFTNKLDENKWLSGDSYAENWWGGENDNGGTAVVERDANNNIITTNAVN